METLPFLIMGLSILAAGLMLAVGGGIIFPEVGKSPGPRGAAMAAALGILQAGIPAAMIATCWREIDARDGRILIVCAVTIALGAAVVGTAHPSFWEGSREGLATVLLGMAVTLTGSLTVGLVYSSKVGQPKLRKTQSAKGTVPPPRPPEVDLPEPPPRRRERRG